ncbi:MAG: insulinase family protein [Oscillospiraceae bacterium]|nr:insulinase family protein [Oscillospiraceae bacterium]
MSEAVKTTIVNQRTGESCIRIDHPSGMPIFVWEKPGYKSSYAVFATKYGSIDNIFDIGGQRTEVPAGIAHYLEHKLFENEDCDAFAQYAKTGASANAYTSFDRTAYLFSCTGDIRPSLKILLNFVQDPYFTAETVAKEQGIIAQEIQMCNDSPARCVLYNLLEAMYHLHPIKIDIAGTLESIAEITPELLYGCYNQFYNLRNMALAVAGNVTADQVLEIADKLLKPAGEFKLERAVIAEPPEVVKARVEQAMPVAAPLFYLGFKYPAAGNACVEATPMAAAAVLLELLAGKSSALYARLMAEGLINPSFGSEFFDGPGYGVWLFAGESRDPDAVAAAVHQEIAQLRRDGIDEELFAEARNALYGRMTASLNDVENCGDILISDYFYGREPFGYLDAAAALTVNDVAAMLAENLYPEQASLSIIKPIGND